MPTNIGEQEKEQLTRLATIFHTEATSTTDKCTEQQSDTVKFNQVQPRVGEPQQKRIENTSEMEEPLRMMQEGNKQHN